MRIRGSGYLTWAVQGTISLQHDELLPGGVQLNVAVRMRPHGVCAIFVSLYARSGSALYEKLFATLHASQEQGLVWGISQGYHIYEANDLRLLSPIIPQPRGV
jgi:hypothetical protein